MSTRDELAGVLADTLNKQFKDMKVAYFLDGTDITPTDIKDFVSTGSTMLDLAISNKPNGGIAVEDIFEAVEEIVAKVRESDKERLVTILVDSLAAATTKVELEADFEKDGWATSKAIIISKAMRKITQMVGRQKIALVFTNQLRQKLGVMFGDPWTTSGGKALPFHASTRIRLKNVGQIKDKKNNNVGMKMRAQVIKNRLGPPMRHADFELYFETGIDDDGSWLKVMKEHKLVKQGGAWYTMLNHKSKELKFQSKDWSEQLEDKEFREHCYNLICDKVILKYEKNFGIDDVVVEEELSE
jgi:recombination protein RecA